MFASGESLGEGLVRQAALEGRGSGVLRDDGVAVTRLGECVEVALIVGQRSGVNEDDMG